MTEPATPAELFARFDALGLSYVTHQHRAIFTVEEGEDLRAAMPGGHSKNLFLRDKKERQLLLSAHQDTAIDLSALAKTLDLGRLSFGSPERLKAALGVTPGSVTAFALVNDPGRAVAFALDAALLRHEVVNFHPLVNTATTSMAPAALLTFLKSLGRDPIVLSFNAAGGATRIDAAAPETYLQHNAFEDFP